MIKSKVLVGHVYKEKFKTINGWTKAEMIEAVKKYMLKHQSVETYAGDVPGMTFTCLYQAPDGNRCAVGCFIPDGHIALKMREGIHLLLPLVPDLKRKLPLNREGLMELQAVHDKINDPTINPRPRVLKWIRDNVVDSK
jgi:hypothetical protein